MVRKQEKGGRSNAKRPCIRSSWGLRPHNIPELPLDIMVNIISRLPWRLIFACKSLSQPINKLISDPSFTQIYRANNSAYFHTIYAKDRRTAFYIDLLEFQKQDVFNKRKHKHNFSRFNFCDSDKDKLFRENGGELSFFSIWGNCNGLFCFMTIESGKYHLFLTNPIFGEVMRLSAPVTCFLDDEKSYYAYGLGYCQFTNRYKVLRIVTTCTGTDNVYKSDSEIITIGIDKDWRNLSHVSVPYNLRHVRLTYWHRQYSPNPQTDMVAFRSALHWIVQRIRMSRNTYLEPLWGGSGYICAFDMTEEKVSALPLPQQVAAKLPFYGKVAVLLDKLCLWQDNISVMNLWVMDEYGVQGSWTKQFILNRGNVPSKMRDLIPLAVSPEGVGVIGGKELGLYDFNKNKSLKMIINAGGSTIHFIPNFVSIRSMFQG